MMFGGFMLSPFEMGLISSFGYLGIFILMALEGSSLPIPSEIVLPVAGALAYHGAFNFYLALAAAVLGSIVGLAVDYYIGYFIGRDLVYKHLKWFHIKPETLRNFEIWLERNGVATVFLSRLIPVVRTIISFPAGFAKMDKRVFFTYSILGTLIWDTALMGVGFYAAISGTDAIVILSVVGVIAIMIYYAYSRYFKSIGRRAAKAA